MEEACKAVPGICKHLEVVIMKNGGYTVLDLLK